MEKNDKFSALRDYEKRPPDFLFEKIREGIEPQAAPAQTSDLKKLRWFEMPVPGPVTEQIFRTLFPKAKIRHISTGRIAAAVAAAAILIVGIWFLQDNKDDSPQNNYVFSGSQTKDTALSDIAPPSGTSPEINDTTVLVQNNDEPSAQPKTQIIRGNSRQAFYQGRTKTRGLAEKTFLMDGELFALRSNDFFTTFASYSPEQVPGFLNEDAAEKTINLDDHTSLKISKKMVRVFKKIYRKPSWRGYFVRKRLEKWKKADQQNFDIEKKNPLNPADLGNFLF